MKVIGSQDEIIHSHCVMISIIDVKGMSGMSTFEDSSDGTHSETFMHRLLKWIT